MRMTSDHQQSGNGRDLSELRRKLEQRRRELIQQMFAKLRDVRIESDTSRRTAPEDPWQVDIQDDLVPKLIEMKSQTLNRIDEALSLIDQGRYGACAECATQIADERLLALPFAVRCRACEEAHEVRSQSARPVWTAARFNSID